MTDDQKAILRHYGALVARCVKDWFARGRTEVSVIALLAGAYDEDSDA